MAADWHEATLTSRCAPAAAQGQILLPNGAVLPKSRRILVENDSGSKLLKVDMRSDPGAAACVPATALNGFGGDGATVRYRAVNLFDVLRRDRGLLLQFLISVLTLVSALLTGWGVYVKSADSGPGSWARESAVWILVLAFLLAAAKFYKDYRDL